VGQFPAWGWGHTVSCTGLLGNLRHVAYKNLSDAKASKCKKPLTQKVEERSRKAESEDAEEGAKKESRKGRQARSNYET